MAIALTSDPIIEVQDAIELAEIRNDTVAKYLINSASDKFLRFTKRSHINQVESDVEVMLRGDGTPTIWVPAYLASVTTVEILQNGDVQASYDSTEFSFDAEAGQIYLHNNVADASDHEQNVRVTCQPGWPTLPGSVTSGAVQLIMYEKDLKAGTGLGVMSESLSGHTVSYEGAGIPKAVRAAWQPFVFMG